MHQYRNDPQNGSTLVVTVLVLVILSILGTAALTLSNTELLIARNMKLNSKAFYLAEAGAEHVYAKWESHDRTLGNGFYNATIGKCDVTNSSGVFDLETCFIESHGIVGDSKKQILTKVTKKILPVDVDAALGLYAEPTNATQIDTEFSGNVGISGYDYKLPYDFNCTGSACDPDTDSENVDMNDPKPSIFITQGTIDDKFKEKTMDFTGVKNGTSEYSNSDWINTSNELKDNVDDENFYNGTVDNDAINLGTREEPVISYIGPGSEINPSTGNSRGSGVLIVDGSAKISGTFHYEGLVIALPDENGDNFMTSMKGTPNIFGSLVVAGKSNINFKMNGNPNVAYSSQAILNAQSMEKLKLKEAWTDSPE